MFMTLLEHIHSRLTRKPNTIKSGTNTTFQYKKPMDQWTAEDRANWQDLVIKEPIEGLVPMVKETVIVGETRASLTEVFKSAQDEVTKSKFE